MSAPSTAVLFLPGATANGIQASVISPTASSSAGANLPTTYSIACGLPYSTDVGTSCFIQNATIITTAPASMPTGIAPGLGGLPEPNYSFEAYVSGPNATQDVRCYITSTTEVQYCIETIRNGGGSDGNEIITETDKSQFTAYQNNIATVTLATTGTGAAPAHTGAAAVGAGLPSLGGLAALGLAFAGVVL